MTALLPDIQILLQALEFQSHLSSQPCIQIAQRFVQQHERGARNDRPCKGEALLLSATKLVGLPVGQSIHFNLRQRQHDFVGQFGFIGHSGPQAAQRKRGIFEDAHMRPDRVGLKHHSDLAFLRRRIEASP